MKTWGRSLADYYRWKEARDTERMERAAKLDIERLRREEQMKRDRKRFKKEQQEIPE